MRPWLVLSHDRQAWFLWWGRVDFVPFYLVHLGPCLRTSFVSRDRNLAPTRVSPRAELQEAPAPAPNALFRLRWNFKLCRRDKKGIDKV